MRTVNKEKELNHRHFVAVRLTDVELNLLDQGAACFSISRSEYLRKLLLEKQINHHGTLPSWRFSSIRPSLVIFATFLSLPLNSFPAINISSFPKRYKKRPSTVLR